jgi:hypothetical protein
VSAYAYVVEFNECGLNSGGTEAAQDWWFRQWNQPGMVRRTTVVQAAPPGALLHIACDDKEEAEFVRDHMISHGIHHNLLKVKRLRGAR